MHSRNCVWPVQLKFKGVRMIPFVMGIYYGSSKPSCFNSFVEPFMTEISSLQNITISGERYNLKVGRFLVDTPAHADVAYIKNLGYYGCPKCEVPGNLGSEGRNVYFKGIGSLRTHESFINRTNIEHHTSSKKVVKERSILEQFQIDMVKDFPLDPLHVVDLGIGVAVINLLSSAKLRGMIPSDLVEAEKIMFLASKHQPSEFNRRIQLISKHQHWKALEYRVFLLFLIPPVFKVMWLRNNSNLSALKLFTKLFVALRIISYDEFRKNPAFLSTAEKLFTQFVNEYSLKYVGPNVTFKVHSLMHLVDDVRTGDCCLYENSTYDFECHNSTIKSSYHKGFGQAQQIHRRFMECINFTQQYGDILHKGIKSAVKMTRSSETAVSYIVTEGMKVSSDLKDSVWALKCRKIVRIHRITKTANGGNNCRIDYHVIDDLIDSFECEGINSSELGVYQSSLKLSVEVESCQVEDLLQKFFITPILNDCSLYMLTSMSPLNSGSQKCL